MANEGKISSNIRLDDLKSVIHKLYFEQGAAEQIENILNGRNDRKGPLSKSEKKMFADNQGFAVFMKKLCIEKALTEVGIETWHSLIDGLNVEGKNVGKVTQLAENNVDVRNKRLQYYLKNDRTVKDLIEHVGSDINKSMEFSAGLRIKIDEFIQIQESTPELKKQREKRIKTIDMPTIDIIEQANGSDEHIKQAATFVLYVVGNNMAISQGPYTYKDLARITMSSGARQAFKAMYKCQSDRQKFNDPIDNKTRYFDKGEKKLADTFRKKMRQDMSGAMSLHKQELDENQIMSLNDYQERIVTLHEREDDIREQYKKSILDISIRKTRSDMEESVRTAEIESIKAEEISGDFYSAYDKAFQGLGDYVANIRDQYNELVDSGKMDRIIEDGDSR